MVLTSEYPLAGNVLLGHIHRARGDQKQALEAYQDAVDAHPDEGGPHYLLGETYQAMSQPESAETEYRLAANLNPQESLPLLLLGRMQWTLGQENAALESFEAAVEATPGWGQAHVALGNALLALDDPAGAARYYQRAQSADGELKHPVLSTYATLTSPSMARSVGRCSCTREPAPGTMSRCLSTAPWPSV
jgi:tetratricopeptide (TPR) repeat protein